MKTLKSNDILSTVKNTISQTPQNDIAIDFCADRSASDGDICDAFSEYADSRIDIYTADLWRWAADNYEFINDWRNECGAGKDILDDIRGGQFLQNEQNLYNDFSAIKETLAREYIGNVILEDLTTTPDALAVALDDLANALDGIDNDDRLGSIAEACNDFIKALNEDSAETAIK